MPYTEPVSDAAKQPKAVPQHSLKTCVRHACVWHRRLVKHSLKACVRQACRGWPASWSNPGLLNFQTATWKIPLRYFTVFSKRWNSEAIVLPTTFEIKHNPQNCVWHLCVRHSWGCVRHSSKSCVRHSLEAMPRYTPKACVRTDTAKNRLPPIKTPLLCRLRHAF